MAIDLKTKKRLQKLADRLCKLDYKEIDKRISHLNDECLVELINSRSRRVGDSAFSLLGGRPNTSRLIISAILSDRMTHKVAKVRAINFLTWQGRACPEAIPAYFHILDDKNEEVADNALFGIVFFQDKSHINRLVEKRNSLVPDSRLRGNLSLAIKALKKQNPFIYCPYFHD